MAHLWRLNTFSQVTDFGDLAEFEVAGTRVISGLLGLRKFDVYVKKKKNYDLKSGRMLFFYAMILWQFNTHDCGGLCVLTPHSWFRHHSFQGMCPIRWQTVSVWMFNLNLPLWGWENWEFGVLSESMFNKLCDFNEHVIRLSFLPSNGQSLFSRLKITMNFQMAKTTNQALRIFLWKFCRKQLEMRGERQLPPRCSNMDLARSYAR